MSSLPVLLGMVYSVFQVIGQYADDADELFDPWMDNCETMNPGNFTNSTFFPQPPPMPYKLSLSRTRINSQQGVYLTLSAPEGLTFQGFMVQARDTRTNEATGQFDTQYNDVKVFNCFGQLDNSAMHADNSTKTMVRLRWVPVSEEPGYVNFYVTVAETVEPLRNYWMNQRMGSVEVIIVHPTPPP